MYSGTFTVSVTWLNLCFRAFWLLLSSQYAATVSVSSQQKSVPPDADILQPYLRHHGPVYRKLRDTQACRHVRYGNTTYSMHPAHRNQSSPTLVVDVHHKITILGTSYIDQHWVLFNFQRVFNPLQTFSVMEPKHPGSCGQGADERSTVQETAATRDCIVAANAGFFSTHTGACLGNVVSDGKLVQDSGGIQNVHFGITKDGQLFTGYLSEIELVTHQFQQLVGGVIWLIRDGEVYVDENRDIECPDTQETGTLDTFINVISARTAVGHDAEGRVLMVQLNGKTGVNGANLHEFALLLKELGFVNAINLDGGGSATSVINGTLVNYPSDSCDGQIWNCARKVTTILCVHEVECTPPDCSGHGQCVAGQCQCQAYWAGTSCDTLSCLAHCSSHGQCQEDGCHCSAGWTGEDCSAACPNGTYGANCASSCRCVSSAACDPVTGHCVCLPGYTGEFCDSVCPYSFYGPGCSSHCSCPDTCFCDHVTGACNTTMPENYSQVGQCMIQARVERDSLVPDQSDRIVRWIWATVCMAILAAVSLGLNAWLTILLLKTRRSKTDSTRRGRFSRVEQLGRKTPETAAGSIGWCAVHSRDSLDSPDSDVETALVERPDLQSDISQM